MSRTPRLPTLFVSHGAPSFALDPGLAGPRLTALGASLPRPQAVLVVSPHWMTATPVVGTTGRPETIHDFGGFAPALYQLDYPAAGHPALAQAALGALRAAGWPAHADDHRGLDHGAWVPLMHLFPDADVPVFQVSLPDHLDATRAWAFGQALAPLAEQGVLVVGSGSLTHNLYEFRQAHGDDEAYVRAFAAWVGEAVGAVVFGVGFPVGDPGVLRAVSLRWQPRRLLPGRLLRGCLSLWLPKPALYRLSGPAFQKRFRKILL